MAISLAIIVVCGLAADAAFRRLKLPGLVGMLLVKSFDRADRIVAAMKCRGFRGRFYVLHHFAFARRDLLFGVASLVGLVGLGWGEWG